LEKFYAKAKASFPEQLNLTLAESFMTKQPVSVRDGATVREALEAFENTRFRVLPVVDDHQRVVGAVTLEDLGNIGPRQMEEHLSERLMHKPLITARDASLARIADMMIEREEDHAFVVDENDRIIGVIAGIDVVRKIMELQAV
jgi:CBS-domain-containing membrane protein